jgi:hypothetical protein
MEIERLTDHFKMWWYFGGTCKLTSTHGKFHKNDKIVTCQLIKSVLSPAVLVITM